MRTEDLINCFNKHIQTRRTELGIDTSGSIAYQYEVVTHKTFKAVKEYKVTIWFIKGGRKFRILSINQVINTSSLKGVFIPDELDKIICKSLFDLINSDIYEQIIMGDYNDNTNKQISDTNNR